MSVHKAARLGCGLIGVTQKPQKSITGHKFCSLRNWFHPTRKLLRTRLNGPAHGADEQSNGPVKVRKIYMVLFGRRVKVEQLGGKK